MKEYYVSKLKFSRNINLKNGILNTDIVYRILSKKELLNLYNLYNEQQKLYKLKIVETAIENNIDINSISDDDIEFICNDILSKSIVSKEDIEVLTQCFDLLNSKDLKGDNWNCETCKEKRLQIGRNCPYLNNVEFDNSIKMYIDGKVFTACPIFIVNENRHLVNTAFSCYTLFNKGILPDNGGFYDQTSFFVDFSLHINSLVKKKEQESIEKSKNG